MPDLAQATTRTAECGNRRLLAALLLLPSLLAAPSASAEPPPTLDRIAQSGVITLGYQTAPPFAYLDQGQPIGYSIDLCLKVVDAVKRELHRPDLKVSFSKVTIASRVQALVDGEIDLECANSANSSVLRDKVAFTIPTFYAATRMMAREGSGINVLADLKNKRVATITGSPAYHLFRQANEARTLDTARVLADDYDSLFALMQADKADVFVADDVLLTVMRAATSSKTMYVLTPKTLSVEPLALMLRKNDPRFKKLVDDELTKLITQGTVAGIYHKWFEAPIPPKQINLKLPMSFMLIDSFKAPSDWVPN